MTPRRRIILTLAWVAVFGAAFAFVEASVVVYLRALYYPDGFTFPLRLIPPFHLGVELAREAATILMLGAVGIIAGTKPWERFGYFLVAFGVWDVLFYVWLKVLLDWPASLFDWDILFLLPVPWIGPVIAPLLVALMMTGMGTMIAWRTVHGMWFRPGVFSWTLAASGAGVILFTFIIDTDATVRGASPAPFRYGLFLPGLLLSAAGFLAALRAPRAKRSSRVKDLPAGRCDAH